MMTAQQQLELTLAGNGDTTTTPVYANSPKNVKRASRADWWFKQMKQVVDRAMDWEPAPRYRPEQIWLNHGSHQN